MSITADQILDVLAEESSVPRASLEPSATLESLGIASLDVISALFTLEDRFGVMVEQEDLKYCNTLQDLIDVVLAISEDRAGAPEA